MGEIVLEQRHGTNEISTWHEAFMNRGKYRGKIAVMTLEKLKEEVMANHKFYHNGQVNWMLKNHLGKVNTYISLNSFGEQDGQTNRQAENVVQIRNIGLDLDFYEVNMTAEQTERAVRDLIAAGEIPNPNLLIYSGNGLQLVYSIQGGVPVKLVWLTKHITSQLILRTSHLGADMACNDVARVFRMPHTINDKRHLGLGVQKTDVSIWRKAEYDLSELYEFCTPIQKRKPKTSGKVRVLPKISEMGYKLRSLNQNRLNDFYKIIELRNGSIEKRNVMTYDFSYILSLMTEDLEEVILQAQRFNTNFDEPQPILEVNRTASRAFEDGRKFWNEYLNNGYSMRGLIKDSDGLKKPKTNNTIITEQEITADEMKHLSTLISKEESYSRKVAKRRAAGVKERSQYEAERQEKQLKMKSMAVELRKQGKTHKKIAELLGVSRGRISQILKDARNEM